MWHLLLSVSSIAERGIFGNRFVVGGGKPAVESLHFQGFAGLKENRKHEKRKNNVLLNNSLNFV
ncbi:hypothetical protein BACCAP_03548 [Pseudoflavonifractor capillosus ATCC 29799]|uniref:Uncharacterized protein n=1 Tax=Pseudoflavonifractor capillosus ATCC 29799 TaxID=411467 RepID=A6NZ96_9FIRM|nr:hypothetical protein BACCAP_03548 [Pseudoflavonifractor capillosus ATCC 29799]